jgi:hypothetical protein
MSKASRTITTTSKSVKYRIRTAAPARSDDTLAMIERHGHLFREMDRLYRVSAVTMSPTIQSIKPLAKRRWISKIESLPRVRKLARASPLSGVYP